MVDGLSQKKSNIAVLDQNELAEQDIFKTVADHAPIMLWMTNRKGMPVFFNQRWLHFTGLEPDEALGDAWLDTLHPDDRAACLEKFEIAFTTFQPLQMEYRLLRYDGVYRYMLDIADPRHDKDGQFAGFVGCTVDMTDQKKNQIELHEMIIYRFAMIFPKREKFLIVLDVSYFLSYPGQSVCTSRPAMSSSRL